MNNKKYIILGIFTIIFTFFGGTLAYWQWETSTQEQTKVTFTVDKNFSCSVDGGGDITSEKITLAPASCTNEKYAIKREITTDVDITGTNMSVLMNLWIDINSIEPDLKYSTNFKYAITTNPDSCEFNFVNGGIIVEETIEDIDTGEEKITLLKNKLYSTSKEEKYYLYIWLDAAEENPDTQNQTFSLSLNGSCTSTINVSEPNEPVLDKGMIPIILSNNGIATVADTSKEWYNYEEKEWANAVLVNENATTGVANSHSRDYYLKNPGTQIASEDILAYYVWIPRYKYKILRTDDWGDERLPSTIEIQFEKTDATKTTSTKVGEYMTHPAFIWDDETVPGIWVGKFETTGNAAKPSILPNQISLREQNISEQFQTSLKFAGGTLNNGDVSFLGNELYGLTTNTDSHMMKNSEWGAVAYLSHSIYGINQEIYANNSSNYYTGRSGGNIGGNIKTQSQQFLDNSLDNIKQYNQYGYYTWTGQKVLKNGTISDERYQYLGTMSSTTGNITGIYDMSGGAQEYVMGVITSDDGKIFTAYSGFSGYDDNNNYILGIEPPNNKYYDSNISVNYDDFYDEIDEFWELMYDNLQTSVFGYAISETSYWYGDLTSYTNELTLPWLRRGGDYDGDMASGNEFGVQIGIFAFGDAAGDGYYNLAFRSVLTITKK